MDVVGRVQVSHVLEVRRQCRSLSEAGRLLFSASRGRESATNAADRLRKHLKPLLERRGFSGFVVLDTNFMVLAAMRDQLIGMQRPPGNAEALASCLAGKVLVTQPFPSVQMLQDQRGNLRAGVPTMFAVAPIRSADGQIIAVLGLRIAPDTDFTRILATARAGQTGETYAFGRDGKQLSESRFDNDLKRLGLIPDDPDSRSILTLELRDPLVDLGRGRQSPKRRTELPFVHAVSEACADPSFRKILNASYLTTPDGMPLVWEGRRSGFSTIARVYGPDLMAEVCEWTRTSGHKHFLYGGAEGVAEEENALGVGNAELDNIRFPAAHVVTHERRVIQLWQRCPNLSLT